MWIFKTFVVAEESFPTIRRQVEVVREAVVEVNPFRNAINNISTKNAHVSNVITTVETSLDHNLNDLSMQLNGILDAAVAGGVSNFKKAFFNGSEEDWTPGPFFEEHPAQFQHIPKFINSLKNQMVIAKKGLALYDQYAVEVLKPHVERLQSCYKEQMSQISDFLHQDTSNFVLQCD